MGRYARGEGEPQATDMNCAFDPKKRLSTS